MSCKDCLINFADIDEKELEELAERAGDIIQYLLLTRFTDLLLKSKSPYFKLLIKLYQQQLDLTILLRDYACGKK